MDFNEGDDVSASCFSGGATYVKSLVLTVVGCTGSIRVLQMKYTILNSYYDFIDETGECNDESGSTYEIMTKKYEDANGHAMKKKVLNFIWIIAVVLIIWAFTALDIGSRTRNWSIFQRIVSSQKKLEKDFCQTYPEVEFEELLQAKNDHVIVLWGRLDGRKYANYKIYTKIRRL